MPIDFVLCGLQAHRLAFRALAQSQASDFCDEDEEFPILVFIKKINDDDDGGSKYEVEIRLATLLAGVLPKPKPGSRTH